MEQYTHFEVQKGWLFYWNLNGLAALKALDQIPKNLLKQIATFILSLQHPNGGFSGSKGFEAHSLASYSTMLSLCLIGEEDFFKQVDRPKALEFIKSLRIGPGIFASAKYGEADIRTAFATLVFAHLLNLDNDPIFDGIEDQALQCQTYEGGFGPAPGIEAHGGFSFCALGILFLRNAIERMNIKKFLNWLVQKQTEYGGFCGRTGKLVDSCYSYWQASCFNVLTHYLKQKKTEMAFDSLYNRSELQKYILIACQDKKGGFKDKPGKPVDYYHSMYSLMGLANSFQGGDEGNFARFGDELELEMHPVIAIPNRLYEKCIGFFRNI